MPAAPKHITDKPITEGYLAGGAALAVTVLWLLFAEIHPVFTFLLYVTALFCASLSTLWLFSREKTIREWVSAHSLRLYTIAVIEILLLAAFLVLALLG